VSISANTTAKGKFFPCGWMIHMQGTLITRKLYSFRANRALGQLLFRDIGHPLKVVMTCVTKVGCAKAEENCHRAAVAALVLQIVCSMFRTHLKKGGGVTFTLTSCCENLFNLLLGHVTHLSILHKQALQDCNHLQHQHLHHTEPHLHNRPSYI